MLTVSDGSGPDALSEIVTWYLWPAIKGDLNRRRAVDGFTANRGNLAGA